MTQALKNAITLTNKAAERVRFLLDQKQGDATALRISLSTKGCSGLSYSVNYATSPEPLDEIIQDKGVTLYIDSKASLFIFGSEMDYKEDKFDSGFVFNNPNEKGRCGCGQSFHI
ncbi:MAG: iron-sulfur cluster assembly accessory protein [Alphaproteobacteria bacterium]|nr:iron-sulfur cluster assembly accessory protein [Alphaproteobacteria bacterium]